MPTASPLASSKYVPRWKASQVDTATHRETARSGARVCDVCDPQRARCQQSVRIGRRRVEIRTCCRLQSRGSERESMTRSRFATQGAYGGCNPSKAFRRAAAFTEPRCSGGTKMRPPHGKPGMQVTDYLKITIRITITIKKTHLVSRLLVAFVCSGESR
jgi:hypothetical protein